MKNHEMRLIRSFDTASEWVCDECGRRLVLQLTPYKKIVLVPGDEYAIHIAQTGLSLMGFNIEQDDPRLNIWKKALGDMDLGDDK